MTTPKTADVNGYKPHKFQLELFDAIKSGKRIAISGGRFGNRKWREMEAHELLHGTLKMMRVGQSIAVCGLDGVRIIRLEKVILYDQKKNGGVL